MRNTQLKHQHDSSEVKYDSSEQFDINLVDITSESVFINSNVDLQNVVQWVINHTKSNCNLGRVGAVCPFVAPALERRCLWLSVVDIEITSADELCRIVAKHVESYRHLPSGVGNGLATYLIVLPRLKNEGSPSIVDCVHQKMKPLVVAHGLMLGEFYPKNQAPGAHNPNFHPLQSPMPLFVLREMVAGDLVFLNRSIDPPTLRVKFLSSYLRSLAGQLPANRINEAKAAVAEAKLELSKRASSPKLKKT